MSASAQSGASGRRFRQTLQQHQRWRKLVRLTRRQKKIDQPPASVADANDLGAKPASRTTQRFCLGRGVAIESRTQLARLLGRAPAAF